MSNAIELIDGGFTSWNNSRKSKGLNAMPFLPMEQFKEFKGFERYAI